MRIMKDRPPPLRFDATGAEAAAEEWGFNCGPAALCAVLGKTPAEIRPHLLDFETKHYMNPTLMLGVLRGLDVKHQLVHRTDDPELAPVWPSFGLCRVQWHGPWTRPGVPMRARYRQTHWIATSVSKERGLTVFDVNALAGIPDWIPLRMWSEKLVPWLLQACVPKHDGRWHITHSIELI